MHVCVCVAAYGTHTYIHTGILYSYLGEICIRNHFKCFRLNTQINRKGFPMNAYECVCTVFLLPPSSFDSQTLVNVVVYNKCTWLNPGQSTTEKGREEMITL